MYDVTVEFPKFKVGVATRGGIVMQLKYLPLSAPSVSPGSELAKRAERQLESYKRDPNSAFELPVVIEGSELQKAVWKAMCAIPRGKTRTYGDLAQELGPHFGIGPREIGQACGDNRLPLVIPCHRIVAANGIGGFAHATSGYLLETKRWLLMHEAAATAFELAP
jgi:methylated-DNA-[protein]-cysteine S-methyltransferase